MTEINKRIIAEIETEKGIMKFELFPEKAPRTVDNFKRLASQGFYNGLTFHRIIRNFMIQGGCPKGDGTGGPGYTIPAEFNDVPHEKGVISMARGRDPDSAGSQFFIVHANHASHLDGAYTAFGKMIEGFDVLDAIAGVPVEFRGSERSKPVEPVKIISVNVFEEEIVLPEKEEEKPDSVEGENNENGEETAT